jgi:hypothetical protein
MAPKAVAAHMPTRSLGMAPARSGGPTIAVRAALIGAEPNVTNYHGQNRQAKHCQ